MLAIVNKIFLVHALTGAEAEEETQPEPQPQATAGMPSNQDVADMIHAMRGSRSSKGDGKGKKGDGKGAKKKGTKFFFRGCWECGDLHHSRHECPQWL